jgi:putative ABC transport system permease protein
MKFATMESDAAENVATPRFRTLLVGVFAALAMSLAMAGVYGVMAYAVGQRSSEIGLRIALGASHRSVLRLILRESLALAAIGLTVGLAAAVAITRMLETMLFQVKPNDPLVYIGVKSPCGKPNLERSVSLISSGRQWRNFVPSGLSEQHWG